MAAPYPGGTPGPLPGNTPGSLEHSNLRAFFGTTRTLTRIWILLGALVGLINLVFLVWFLIHLSFAGGGIGGLVYAVLWVGVDLLILERMPHWEQGLASGAYQGLKEPLLLWGILGLIFGVVPGVLLLVVYVKILPWADAAAPPHGAVDPGRTTAVPPAPPYTPPAPPGTPPPP